MSEEVNEVAEAIREVFVNDNSPGDYDNIAGGVSHIAMSLEKLVEAIIPPGTDEYVPTDAAGGCVGSLTESIMGVTAGLVKVAEAIENASENHRDGLLAMARALEAIAYRPLSGGE